MRAFFVDGQRASTVVQSSRSSARRMGTSEGVAPVGLDSGTTTRPSNALLTHMPIKGTDSRKVEITTLMRANVRTSGKRAHRGARQHRSRNARPFQLKSLDASLKILKGSSSIW